MKGLHSFILYWNFLNFAIFPFLYKTDMKRKSWRLETKEQKKLQGIKYKMNCWDVRSVLEVKSSDGERREKKRKDLLLVVFHISFSVSFSFSTSRVDFLRHVTVFNFKYVIQLFIVNGLKNFAFYIRYTFHPYLFVICRIMFEFLAFCSIIWYVC